MRHRCRWRCARRHKALAEAASPAPRQFAGLGVPNAGATCALWCSLARPAKAEVSLAAEVWSPESPTRGRHPRGREVHQGRTPLAEARRLPSRHPRRLAMTRRTARGADGLRRSRRPLQARCNASAWLGPLGSFSAAHPSTCAPYSSAARQDSAAVWTSAWWWWCSMGGPSGPSPNPLSRRKPPLSRAAHLGRS